MFNVRARFPNGDIIIFDNISAACEADALDQALKCARAYSILGAGYGRPSLTIVA